MKEREELRGKERITVVERDLEPREADAADFDTRLAAIEAFLAASGFKPPIPVPGSKRAKV